MDADRKSTVSSFYHGRQPSNDALNSQFPRVSTSAGGGQRAQRDDVSSFFTPDRNSIDRLNNTGVMSAGYNKNSFFHGGREEPLKGGKDEEEEAWDVYADFNNSGPRYSTTPLPTTTNSSGCVSLNALCC